MSLQILWFILVVFLLGAYYVLDGFDLGSGIISPLVAKTEAEKSTLITAIGPVWDGNEVWLLAGGGALFAAFAPAYATAFSGFYLAIMLVLFGLIIRAVSLEFRMHDEKWRKLWDVLFFIGSLVPALLFGVALGNCLQGIGLDMNGDYTGSFFGLLRPFPLLCGLLGLMTIVTQGACWLCAKVELGTELQARTNRIRLIAQIITLVLVALTTFAFFAINDSWLGQGAILVIVVIAAAVVIIGIVIGFLAGSRAKDWLAFFANSFVCIALLALFAATLFPDLIVSNGPGPSITIASAASSDYALTVMTVIACIGVPLVLIYHIIVYRTFRGRIPVEENGDY